MSVWRLVVREIGYRKLNFATAAIAVTVAVTLAVAAVTMSEGARRETVRLMRNMGFNLLIIPEQANFADFWSEDFAQADMPEEYAYRLTEARSLDIQHVVARLQKKIVWRGRKVLLTGLLPELQMKHMPQKSPMSPTIERGTAWVGYELWRAEQIAVGDEIEVLGQRWRVVKLLPETGSKDDIRIWGHLHDVQAALGMPGRINEIECLHCLCGDNALATVRANLRRELPGTQVTEFQTLAVMRAETRRMMDRYAAFLIPAIWLVCALWVGLGMLGNVRERRAEIGIYRAQGVSAATIAALFLAKAALIGLVGAAVGFGLGTALALQVGPRIFVHTARSMAPEYPALAWSLLAGPAVALIASWLPALHAVTQDPAEVLREE